MNQYLLKMTPYKDGSEVTMIDTRDFHLIDEYTFESGKTVKMFHSCNGEYYLIQLFDSDMEILSEDKYRDEGLAKIVFFTIYSDEKE